jgi:hypothetical protein
MIATPTIEDLAADANAYLPGLDIEIAERDGYVLRSNPFNPHPLLGLVCGSGSSRSPLPTPSPTRDSGSASASAPGSRGPSRTRRRRPTSASSCSGSACDPTSTTLSPPA